jgi:hypothetical protein
MVTATLRKPVLAVVACFIFLIYSSSKKYSPGKTGTVTIGFLNNVAGMPLIFDSIAYTNPFNEIYRVSKLKYYISNVTLSGSKHSFTEPDSYHLIDAADNNSLVFSFTCNINNYTAISFMVGVDSIKNVSGAQSGALDPANGMFWTWNSGYIFFKLEGNSSHSSIINHKVEYHIGGFWGSNNALQIISLPLTAGNLVTVKEGKATDIIIAADINKLWQGNMDLKITNTPAIMTPGILSKNIAGNYSDMFSIRSVTNK